MRRWTIDYARSVSEAKYGEISLIFRRSIINTIGLYDSVRFSGDSEFRLRLTRVLGPDAIVKIPKELYFLRVSERSLTTSTGSRVFIYENDELSVIKSPDRQRYLDNFTRWQKRTALT